MSLRTLTVKKDDWTMVLPDESDAEKLGVEFWLRRDFLPKGARLYCVVAKSQPHGEPASCEPSTPCNKATEATRTGKEARLVVTEKRDPDHAIWLGLFGPAGTKPHEVELQVRQSR